MYYDVIRKKDINATTKKSVYCFVYSFGGLFVFSPKGTDSQI